MAFTSNAHPQALAGHYGFSPRLLGVMCDKHMTPAGPVIDDPHHTNRVQAYVNSKIRSERKSVETESPSPDLEKLEMRDSPRSAGSMLDLNHYRIADEVWHFSSVDLGPRCKILVKYQSISANSGQICVLAIILFTIRKVPQLMLLIPKSALKKCPTGKGCGLGWYCVMMVRLHKFTDYQSHVNHLPRNGHLHA